MLSSFDVVFTVIRDPMVRLQSEYLWWRAHSLLPLPDFDVWVNQMFDTYALDPFMMNNHIRPQDSLCCRRRR